MYTRLFKNVAAWAMLLVVYPGCSSGGGGTPSPVDSGSGAGSDGATAGSGGSGSSGGTGGASGSGISGGTGGGNDVGMGGDLGSPHDAGGETGASGDGGPAGMGGDLGSPHDAGGETGASGDGGPAAGSDGGTGIDAAGEADGAGGTSGVDGGAVSLTDPDGNTYKTVKIGTQVWMAENLRTTKYNDGTPITLGAADNVWASATSEKYCFYGNTTNAADIKMYGALYNWYAVGTKKLAPQGWHVPTAAEWDTLQNYLIANGYNYDGTTAENKVAKALAAATGWATTGTAGAPGNDQTKNNKSGFNAYATGYRYRAGNFYSRGSDALFWTATENDATTAMFRSLLHDSANLVGRPDPKAQGYSVRLVHD